MKIGFDNSYLFPAGNKNGLVRNEPDAIWTKTVQLWLDLNLITINL